MRNGSFGGLSTRIERGFWLQQQHLCFLFCDRQMLDAARNDHKLSRVQMYLAIAQFDKQVSGDDQEEFVLLFMMMPDKLALQFDELDMRIVQLAHNFRTPRIMKLREFFG